MKPIYQRTAMMIGEEGLQRLTGAKVLVVGLGGVGGYVAEALCRAGIGTLGLCDFDTVDESNLNRQILALRSSVGQPKALCARDRLQQINEDCILKIYPFKIAESPSEDPGVKPVDVLELSSYDYIADAIDDVPAKLAFICRAKELGIPVISSMGTGNKLDPSRFMIADIAKTHTDPLAKSVRVQLRKRGIERGVKVLFSDEEPVVKGARPIPSISYMPGTAGLMIAGQILRDLLNGGSDSSDAENC